MKLSDYIQGKRHGQEANRLEREAMNDPFLQDAIDGYDRVEGDHSKTLAELERQIQRRGHKKSSARRIWMLSIAASLLLLIGIGSILHFGKSPIPEYANTTKPVEKKALVPDSAKTEQTNAIIQPKPQPSHTILAVNSKKKKLVVQDSVKSFMNAEQSKTDLVQKELEITNSPMASVENDSIPETEKIPLVAATSRFLKRTDGIIQGQITDEKGEPLIGATVKVKGTNIGSVTDMKGFFEILVPKGKETKRELVVNYIGYKKREIPVHSDSNVIKMEPDNLALNEVVVVGYGTQKHSDMTGSISVPKMPLSTPYGETEFSKYYQSHRKAGLCDIKSYVLKASFEIDATGKPVHINVSKSPCTEVEQEFIKMLEKSPKWTKANRKVRMRIKI